MKYEEIFVNAKKCDEKSYVKEIIYKKSFKTKVIIETIFYSSFAVLLILNIISILDLIDENFSILNI